MNKLNFTDIELIEAVKNNISITGTLRTLGLSIRSGYYNRFINSKIRQLNINTEHWKGEPRPNVIYNLHKTKLPDNEFFVENSKLVHGHIIRNRLIKGNYLKYECSKCFITEWNNEQITLQVDHVNGINNDNRLENLRFLCPNCHSQTDTYCGKNVKNKTVKTTNNKKVKYKIVKQAKSCAKCYNPITSRAKHCRKCHDYSKNNQKPKINWPNIETLQQMIQDSNYSAVGRLLGVSDNAIRKHLKKHLTLPVSVV